MQLEIAYRGESIPVEIVRAAGRDRVCLGGKEVPCEWLRIRDGQYSIIMDGRVFDLRVEISGETCVVSGRGTSFRLHISDPRRLSYRQTVERGEAGLQRITAEMPGKVIRVLVKPGDAVEFDQGLLVIEAMKMQNEIRAPKGGMVREVGVVEGRAVNTGDLLVSLE